MKLLTLKEASKIVNVPEATIRFWLSQSRCEIPFKKLPNGRIVIREDELLRWMQALPRHQGVSDIGPCDGNCN
jgi:hypothetical protein